MEQTDTDYPHPTTESGPDSQTDRSLAHNSASGCNAARFLHHNTGFEVGTANARSDRRVHPFSDGPKRCIRRATTDYLHHRSSHAECRFGRSGSSGFVGGFLRLRWSGCGLAPRARSCRARCRYRYICRPKRIRFPLRGRLKGKNCIGTYCTHHARIKSFIYVTPCWRW